MAGLDFLDQKRTGPVFRIAKPLSKMATTASLLMMQSLTSP
jgi:hypothetical protein